jgi:hypothetical protein
MADDEQTGQIYDVINVRRNGGAINHVYAALSTPTPCSCALSLKVNSSQTRTLHAHHTHVGSCPLTHSLTLRANDGPSHCLRSAGGRLDQCFRARWQGSSGSRGCQGLACTSSSPWLSRVYFGLALGETVCSFLHATSSPSPYWRSPCRPPTKATHARAHTMRGGVFVVLRARCASMPAPRALFAHVVQPCIIAGGPQD